jgi:hypothetical protein
MLYAISKGFVEGYLDGQESVVYLVSTAESVQKAGLPFVFTDGHGIMAITEFFHDLKDLKNIDWDIMKETYWNDTDEDPDRKRRRQAEFLVHKFFPWNLLIGIGVYSAKKESQAEKMIAGINHIPLIKTKRNWYYKER